jgi:hypothetical protein
MKILKSYNEFLNESQLSVMIGFITVPLLIFGSFLLYHKIIELKWNIEDKIHFKKCKIIIDKYKNNKEIKTLLDEYVRFRTYGEREYSGKSDDLEMKIEKNLYTKLKEIMSEEEYTYFKKYSRVLIEHLHYNRYRNLDNDIYNASVDYLLTEDPSNIKLIELDQCNKEIYDKWKYLKDAENFELI